METKRASLCIAVFMLILLQNVMAYRHVIQETVGASKVSNVVFYVHSKLTKPNETVEVVASSDDDYETTTKFGTIGVGNIVLTAEQSNSSKVVGRLKSMVIIADTVFTDYPHAQELLTAELETEEYNGTLSLHGRDVATGYEIPVVGGTGYFRGVRGWANITHVEYNLPDSTTMINATLVYPPYF